MRLGTFFGADDEQDNSTDKRQTAEDGGNGNMFVFFGGGVDGPDIQDFFLMGVGESLIGERQGAENNQENSSHIDEFHGDRSGAKPSASGLETG